MILALILIGSLGDLTSCKVRQGNSSGAKYAIGNRSLENSLIREIEKNRQGDRSKIFFCIILPDAKDVEKTFNNLALHLQMVASDWNRLLAKNPDWPIQVVESRPKLADIDGNCGEPGEVHIRFFQYGENFDSFCKETQWDFADRLNEGIIERCAAHADAATSTINFSQANVDFDVTFQGKRYGMEEKKRFLILHEYGHLLGLLDTKTIIQGKRVPIPGQPPSVMNGGSIILTTDDFKGIQRILTLLKGSKENRNFPDMLCGKGYKISKTSAIPKSFRANDILCEPI